MFLFGKRIISVFNPNDQLITIAYECINVYGISFLFAAVNIVFTTNLLATKHTKQAVFLAVLRSFVCNTVFIFLLPLLLGKGAVWTGIIVAELVVMIAAFIVKSRISDTYFRFLSN